MGGAAVRIVGAVGAAEMRAGVSAGVAGVVGGLGATKSSGGSESSSCAPVFGAGVVAGAVAGVEVVEVAGVLALLLVTLLMLGTPLPITPGLMRVGGVGLRKALSISLSDRKSVSFKFKIWDSVASISLVVG